MFRCETLHGRSRQLYRMPAFEALGLARHHAAIMAGMNLSPGIVGSAATPEHLSFDSWRA